MKKWSFLFLLVYIISKLYLLGFSTKAKLVDLGIGDTVEAILEDLAEHDDYKDQGGLEAKELFEFYRQIITNVSVIPLVSNMHNGILFYGKYILPFNERDELIEKQLQWDKKTILNESLFNQSQKVRYKNKELFHEYGKYLVLKLMEEEEILSPYSSGFLIELDKSIGSEETQNKLNSLFGYVKDKNIGDSIDLRNKVNKYVENNITLLEPYLDPIKLGNNLYVMFILDDTGDKVNYEHQEYHMISILEDSKKYLTPDIRKIYERSFLKRYQRVYSKIEMKTFPAKEDLLKY